MTKTILTLLLTLSLTGLALPASAKAKVADPNQDLITQAQQQGEVDVIVTLGSNQPLPQLLAGLNTEPVNVEKPSYTAQQEAFMQKLGSKGVLENFFFDESPTIKLKLDAEALKKLLQIKDVVNIAPAFNADAL